MALRIVGILLLLLGLALSGFCAYGLLTTQTMAEQLLVASQSRNIAFDAQSWSLHWRLYGAILLCIAIGVAVAGGIVARRQPKGLLLFAGASIFSAVFPWVYVQLGLAKYGFESATFSESCFFFALALIAMFTYSGFRKTSVGT